MPGAWNEPKTFVLGYGIDESTLSARVARTVVVFAAATILLAGLHRAMPAAAALRNRCIASADRRALYKSCLTYAVPSDAAEYDQAVTHSPWSQPIRLAAGRADALSHADARAAGVTSVRCVSGLRQLAPHLHAPPEIVPLFLHGRRAPGEGERLVYVTFDATAFAAGDPRPLHIELFSPAGAIHSWRKASQQTPLPLPRDAHPPVRLFFGQPDPANASHFSIPYQIGSRRGVIDGRLRQDDRIELASRDVGLTGNNNGTFPECRTAILPRTLPSPGG